MIGKIKFLSQKGAEGIKKLRMDDDIPMLAGVALFPLEAVNVVQVQENHITGVQGAGLAVEGVGDGALQNIENLIELMAVNDFIAIFCDFGVKGLFRGCHPIFKNDMFHICTSLHSIFNYTLYTNVQNNQEEEKKKVNTEQVVAKKYTE